MIKKYGRRLWVGDVIKVDDESVRVGTIVDDPEEMRVVTTADAPRIPELVRGHEPGAAIMGDEWTLEAGSTAELTARFALPATIRLVRNGREIAVTEARTFSHRLHRPGVYRVEG